MADILVHAFMIYTVIAVTFGLSLLLYSWYLSVKYSKDDSPWTDWHDIGECDICGRQHHTGGE